MADGWASTPAPNAGAEQSPTRPTSIGFRDPGAIPPPLRGRDDEVAEVLELLATGTRLITLRGPGGIGKTRIAEACHATLVSDGAMPVHAVELADIDADQLLDEVCRVLIGPISGPGNPLDRVTTSLANEPHVLILDTCEHLLAAGATIDELLERCPHLAVLTTSQTSLHSSHERVVPVGPLSEADASALFEERAGSRRTGVEFDPMVVTAICEALDGSPLAIELAAARATLLTPEEISRWLTGDDGRPLLDLLSRGSLDQPTRPARHHSVRAVATWSDQLLTPEARALFRRLGAFAGPMTLADIEGVSDGHVLDALDDLVALQLVRPVLPDVGGPWFRLLDPLREFAREQARAEGTHADLQHRHARWYGQLAAEAEAGLHSGDEPRWRSVLDTERPNLMAALSWLEGRSQWDEAFQLIIDLGPLWLHQGPIRQGIATMDRLLQAASPDVDPSVRALATVWWARLRVEDGDVRALDPLRRAHHQLDLAGDAHRRLRADEHLAHALLIDGDHIAAAAAADAMRRSARTVGDRYGEVGALILLSRAAQHSGASDDAATWAHQALEIADAIGHGRLAARAEQALAELAAARGIPGGQPAPLATLAAYESVGDRRGIVLACANLGIAALDQDDRRSAADWFLRVLREASSIDYRHGEAFAVTGIAATAILDGRHTEAITLHGSLLTAAPSAAAHLVPPNAWAGYLDLIESTRQAIGPTAFDGALRAATPSWPHTLQRAEALGTELATPVSPRSSRTFGPLSPREHEVLTHLASGATNRQIAEQLHLSPKTVMHHTSSIFRKLGVRGRAEAVDVGHRTGLLTTIID